MADSNLRRASSSNKQSVIKDTFLVISKERMNQGNRLYKDKRYSEALKCFSDAIRMCPDNVLYYGNRCVCLMMMSKIHLALEDAQTCVTLSPTFVRGYVRQAKCYILLGDLKSAYRSIKNIIRLDPKNTELARLVKFGKLVHTFIKEYEKQLSGHDSESALASLNKALEVASHCTKYKLLKAELLVMLSRYQEAQDVVTDLIRFEPTNADALCMFGVALYYQNNIDKSFTYFEKTLQLSPSHERARAVYEKAKELKARKEEGDAACTSNNMEKAFSIYTFALQIDTHNIATNAKLYFNRSIVLGKMSRINEAIKDCTNAIQLDENYFKAYLRRAKLYSDLEMYEESVQDYEKVCQQNETDEYIGLLKKTKSQLKRAKCYYNILELTKPATNEEIRKAYKQKALLHHPDRHSGESEEFVRREESKFKKIREAYSALMDVKKRLQHEKQCCV